MTSSGVQPLLIEPMFITYSPDSRTRRTARDYCADCAGPLPPSADLGAPPTDPAR
jgi:hypothetical protein